MLDPELRDAAEARLHVQLARITDAALDGVATILAEGATVESVAEANVILGAATRAAHDTQMAYLDLMVGDSPTAVTVDVPLLDADTLTDLDPIKLVAEARQQSSTAVWDSVTTANEEFGFAHPELDKWLRRVSPGEVCGLCVQAAMRVYGTPSLRPIHDHCRCTVRPVLGDDDLGSIMGEARARFDAVTADLVEISDELGAVRGGRKVRSRSSNVRIDV